MAIDFSVEPFFDDYSDDKKFYKILFRPGYAVQARELTQLQTILQQQISRHGDHIFKEGSMVIPGQISYDLYVDYVKLTFTPIANVKSILDSLLGKDIKNSRGLIAKVINYTLKEGDDLDTIFVKYQNTIQDNAGNNVSVFNVDDFLSPVDGTSGLDVVVADTGMPTGRGSTATIQRGVYYIKKNFVLVQEQTIILDKYTNNSSYRVGLQYNEEIVYPENDESLLDNSLGSPNYSAPGAARHYIDLVLTKLPLNSTQDESFIDLLRLREGKVLFKIDRSQYAELEKTLARRTYDESGDYALSPFGIQVKEFRNNLRGDWAPSEKFIQGDLIKVLTGNGIHFWYFVAVTNGISGQNRPTTFSNAATGIVDSVSDNSITWEYIQSPNFNQGINTFTAGDTFYSQFTLNDHLRLDGMLALGVEAGKAYVRGYEIEKLATEYLPVEKSRYLPAGSAALCEYFDVDSLPEVTDSVSSQKTANIDVSMGSYVIGNAVKYLPNLTQLVEVNLHSVVYGSATVNTIIGKARVRALEKHINSGEFKVFLFDIRMNAGKDFKNVKSIYTTSTAFAANLIQTNNETILQNPQGSSLIFNLPDYAIASVIETTYSVVIPFTATASGGSITIAKPIGYTFESISTPGNCIISKNDNGDHVTTATLSINVSGSLVISGVTNVAHSILATLKRADQTDATSLRTATDASPITLATAATAQQSIITLDHSYVTRIVSVTMDSRGFNQVGGPIYNTDITNRYTFNSGQFNTHIGLSSISLVSGATPPIGSILIKYEYLTSTTDAGDFIATNSYTHSTSRIRYDQISNVNGVSLRDSIDFRPYQVGASFQLKYFPKFGTTASFKYVNYLSRIDNISLSSVGKFYVSRGIPSERAIEAGTPTSSMKIAQLSIEPYTFKRGDQFGVIVNRYENKRYTMRDIGKLERRIQDLEYYTSLSLLEVDTKSMRIVDSEGFERYQNGFLVDSFDGQGVGNAASEDWNASIDQQNKELRPFFSQRQVALFENVNATTKNYKVSGDLVTLPFTETAMITQPKASMSESVNPYELYSWKGVVSINPWSDTWFSTSYRPDIILNDESQYNAIVSKAEEDGILGTVWNSWQTVFSSTKSLATRKENLGAWSTVNTEIVNANSVGVGNGPFWRARESFTTEELAIVGTVPGQLNGGVAGTRILTIETQAVETQASRVGTRSFVVDKVDSRVLEDRLVDTQVVPYIRPRAVLFTGYGFKPSTNMYAFFDNIIVNDYIIPATRIEVTPITKTGNTLYPHKFDVERNAGSAVSNPERTVNYSEGVQISGTVSVTAGSSTVTGSATSFNTQVQADDILNFGDNLKFRVTAVTDNTTLTISPAFNGTTTSGVSARVIGPKNTTEEIEIAFNHGEVIKEVGGNGNTAIVVGQEVFGGKYYLYVMNIKGNGQFSASGYLEGEYTSGGDKPRVKFVPRSKQNFTTLQTTFTGLLCGIFRIPSNPILKFRTGTRELTFSNDPNTNTAIRSSRESTSGSAFYEAKGLIEIMQRTIVSTRTANIVAEQVSDTNTVVTVTDRLTRDTGWYDPLAQTFQIQNEGGAFLTSVDVFFAARDAKTPVRVEIREVVNGYPGSVILPFSVVEKKAEEVTISNDSSVATNFKFISPVFVQNGAEYALVVLSDSAAWRVWVSQTEQVDVLTGRAILSQPYNGVFFKSQNGSTWTADQTQDMKFVINRAEFAVNPVSIELIPPKLGFTNLGFNPFNMITGSRRCRVTHRNHGMIATERVMFKSRQVIDSINGIASSNIFDIPHTIISAELDSYVIEFGGTVNSSTSGQVGGGFISASENYEFQTAMAEIAEIVPPGTSISYTANVINHEDQVDSYNIAPKENYTFEETKVYPSTQNYSNAAFPSGLNIVATLTPASSNRSISPVIDLGRLALTMVSNKVDSPGLEIIDDVLDKFLVGSSIELGTGKPIDLVDLNNDSVPDTIVINSVTAATLFTNMNNNLKPGDVLRFTYSGVTDADRNMVIVEKTQETVSGSVNLYFTLEGFDKEVLTLTTTGQTVKIEWLSHYKDDYAALSSSTTSKYVTKKINFSRSSEMLKIMFAAAIPPEAEVEIYYKTGLAVDGDFIASRYFLATPKSYSKSENQFTEVIADVEGLPPFDSVIIKLVMKSINKAKVPRIKDFRVIAVAS